MARALCASILAIAAAPDGALAASLCMDVPDLSSIQHGSGGPVQVWDCLNSDKPGLSKFARANQQWLVEAYTGGPQKIQTRGLIWLCLDLASGDTTNGNAVEVWECNGLDNQQWVFGDDYHIRYYADQSKCVDAGDMQDGTRLQIWDCNSLSQQNWGYDPDGHKMTIYLSDSRRLLAPALGRLRSARNASAAASNLAAAAALTTGRALRSTWERQEEAATPRAGHAAEQRGSSHSLASSPCPVNPSQRSCNPGDAGKSFDAACVSESGDGLRDGLDIAVAKAYPGCQPCDIPNGDGGFDWKLFAIEDHHC
jgi:hypothetical protein